ncbi:glyoxalase, partial [Listeria monocytogenes]
MTLQDPDTMGIILTAIPATNSNPTIHTDISAEKQIARIIGADYHAPDPAANSQFFTNLFG